MSSHFQLFDSILGDGDAMLRLAEDFGHYGMYGEESIEDDFGKGLAQRHSDVIDRLTQDLRERGGLTAQPRGAALRTRSASGRRTPRTNAAR
jgi:hypothetical protein